MPILESILFSTFAATVCWPSVVLANSLFSSPRFSSLTWNWPFGCLLSNLAERMIFYCSENYLEEASSCRFPSFASSFALSMVSLSGLMIDLLEIVISLFSIDWSILPLGVLSLNVRVDPSLKWSPLFVASCPRGDWFNTIVPCLRVLGSIEINSSTDSSDWLLSLSRASPPLIPSRSFFCFRYFLGFFDFSTFDWIALRSTMLCSMSSFKVLDRFLYSCDIFDWCSGELPWFTNSFVGLSLIDAVIYFYLGCISKFIFIYNNLSNYY